MDIILTFKGTPGLGIGASCHAARKARPAGKPQGLMIRDTDNGMAAYFNYIRALLGENYYTQLVNHFIQSDYLYTDSLKLEEWMLYSSSRLGSHRLNKPVAAITYTGAYENVELVYEAPCPHELTDFILVRGNKRYELSNHLGNVLTVVSDKKIPVYIPNPLHDGDFSTDEEGWTGGWSAAGSGWIPAPSPPYTYEKT